jgi:hypothetical protein
VLRRSIEAHLCAWCERGPFKNLARHTYVAHGISGRELRELASLPATATICSPELSSTARRALLNRPDREEITARGLAAAREAEAAWQAEVPEGERRAGNRGADATARRTDARYAAQHDDAEVLFRAGDLTLTEIAERVGLHARTVAHGLRRRGYAVDDHTAILRKERIVTIRPAAIEARSEAARAEATARAARFATLGSTWEALMQMADEEKVTRKSMADALRSAGARVPDGRTASPLKGTATGRVYAVKAKAKCGEEGCDTVVKCRGLCSKHYQRRRKLPLA